MSRPSGQRGFARAFFVFRQSLSYSTTGGVRHEKSLVDRVVRRRDPYFHRQRLRLERIDAPDHGGRRRFPARRHLGVFRRHPVPRHVRRFGKRGCHTDNRTDSDAATDSNTSDDHGDSFCIAGVRRRKSYRRRSHHRRRLFSAIHNYIYHKI